MPITSDPESKEHEAFMEKQVSRANLKGKIEKIEMIDPVEIVELNKFRYFLEGV